MNSKYRCVLTTLFVALIASSALLAQTVSPPSIVVDPSLTCIGLTESVTVSITLPATPGVGDIDVAISADPALDGLTVVTTPSVQPDIGPGETATFNVSFTGNGNFFGGEFQLTFSDLASTDILDSIPVSLRCSPVCIPPTPAIELGADPLTVFPGGFVGFDIVAIAQSMSVELSIIGLTASYAPFAGGGCGAFTPVSLPSGVFSIPGLPVTGTGTVSTSFDWFTTGTEPNGCWRFTYMLQDENGNTAECTVEIRLTECLLLGGFAPLSQPVTANDTLWVDPIAALPISLTGLPAIHVPNDPAMMGLKAYFQTLLVNPSIFPEDPIKMSQGIEVEIGVGVTSYGTASGMNVWLDEAVIYPGDTFQVPFSIVGF